MIISTMRLTSHAACREALKDAYRALVEKPEGKISTGGPQYRQEDNTEIDMKEIG
jgi:hypothetical protein